MQIHEAFRKQIGIEISGNRRELAQSSIDWLNQNFMDHRKIAAFRVSYNGETLDPEFGKNFILAAASDEKNMQMTVPWGFPRHFDENHVHANLTFTDIKLNGDYEEKKFAKRTQELKKLNDHCFDSFLSTVKIEEVVDLSFDAFIEKVVRSEQIGMTYGYAVLLFNNENWLQFYLRVIGSIFDKYPFQRSFSSAKIMRFARPLTRDLFFGFEIDLGQSVANNRSGDLSTPNFNIILFSSNFKRSVAQKHYLLKSHDAIMSFGLLGNPFFFYPCIPLLSYVSIKQMDQNRQEYLYINQLISEKDDMVRIIGPPEFGELMKKYAYFYLSLLKDSSQTYLNYLEDCILKAVAHSSK